jgi:putative hydrolase of the HAD superfamily
VTSTAAVFFDVDFTLIEPGHRFRGAGYAETCERHGLRVDAAGFEAGVLAAAALLDGADVRYDHEVFVRYTARIIEVMGGNGPAVRLAAQEIYADWAEHRHFEMYADVPGTLRHLHARGVRLGLISNSHRCLISFQDHFALAGLIDVCVSSAEFGVMKPDPRIFVEGLTRMGVEPGRAVMVGDSLPHDIAGARGVGMGAVYLDRERRGGDVPALVPTIHSLEDLAVLVE